MSAPGNAASVLGTSRSMKFGAMEDIDEAAVVALVREAVKLNLEGATVRRERPAARVPPDLKRAFAANPEASKFFAGLAPGYRREFIDWIESAKRPATREKRLAGTVEKCARGERRNDRYRKGC